MKINLRLRTERIGNKHVLYARHENEIFPRVIGAITDYESIKNGSEILYVNFYDKLQPNDIIFTNQLFDKDAMEIIENEDGYSTNQALDPASLANNCINSQTRTFTLIDNKKRDKYHNIIVTANKIKLLIEQHPEYQQIVTYDEDDNIKLNTILDIILMHSPKQQEQYFNMFASSKDTIADRKRLSDKIIQNTKVNKGVKLLSSDQQIDAFIKYSALQKQNYTEYATDEEIEDIKNSTGYQVALDKLKEHGFKISQTQQFNVLQSIGFFKKLNWGQTESNIAQRVLYNLSDMGAGKTLMTVEAIFSLDMDLIVTSQKAISKEIDKVTKQFELPPKTLIAPLLSVESSWVKTFKLFYDVKKIDDTQYQLTIKHEGRTYVSKLIVGAFTQGKTQIKVKNKVPFLWKSTLIIDEIHQLLHRTNNAQSFFGRTPTELNITSNYRTFVLSGTLSNLTVDQWYNYLKFMNINTESLKTANGTASSYKKNIDEQRQQLERSTKRSMQKITSLQQRTLDDDVKITTQNQIKEPNSKEAFFKLTYGSKYIKPYIKSNNVKEILESEKFEIQTSKTDDTINFKLFYRIVGKSAITSESTVIATELFGKQEKQHKSELINVDSELTNDDIDILKTLNNIATDHEQYKSKTIANRINNSILNLNDGLNNQSIYDIIAENAQRNTRFLKYLSDLNINVLENIAQSGLIKQPNLADTKKFQILQSILKDNENETCLIVVNDFDAMNTLSDALKLPNKLTFKDTKDAIHYQNALDDIFAKQSVVVVPQEMIKSSIDLIQVNRLIQYQLNTDITDIIQTQNRINRIGQTRETKAYYIATDELQNNIIESFLQTYQNIDVAHKGIIELFTDMSDKINITNDYINDAMRKIGKK